MHLTAPARGTWQAPVFRVKGSSPARKGASFTKTFTRFPEYAADPWDDKIKAARQRAADERTKMYDSKPFKPMTNDLGYRSTKGAAPAFQTLYTSTIVFRPSNLGR